MVREIKIKDEYITLGQLLKLADFIQTGGEAKMFLSEYEVKVNDEIENRRGKKLVPGDVVTVGEQSCKVVSAD